MKQAPLSPMGHGAPLCFLLFLCHSHHLLTQALYRVKENQREKDLVTRTRVFELSKRKFKEVRLLYLPIPNFPRFQHGVGLLKIYEHAKFGWHKVIGSPALC